MMKIGRHVRLGVTGLSLVGATLVTPMMAKAQTEPAPSPNTGRLSLSASVDWTTAYFYRGILQEDQGIIVQPGIELGVNLFQGDGTISSVDIFGGIWNSIHDERTGAPAGDNTGSWYEADLYIGASVTLFQNISAGMVFTTYTSPADAFDTINEIAIFASYDDSHLWEEIPWFVGFAPGVTLAIETHGSAFGPDEGVYLELSITPTFDFFDEGCLADLEIAVPVVLGLGLDDYYETTDDDDTFGYVSVGIVGTLPLPIPAEFGQWTLSAGVNFLFLGNNLDDANNDDDFEVIGTLGLGISY